MIVDKFSQTQKGGDHATVIKDDYHVLAIPSSGRRRFGNAFSRNSKNTDASVAGGIGTGTTGITDVVLTQAPKFGGAPTRGPRPDNDAKSRARCFLGARPAKDTCTCVCVCA